MSACLSCPGLGNVAYVLLHLTPTQKMPTKLLVSNVEPLWGSPWRAKIVRPSWRRDHWLWRNGGIFASEQCISPVSLLGPGGFVVVRKGSGSWPPFAPGNQVSIRHGAWSPRRVDPIAAELVEHALSSAPYLVDPSYAPAVHAWADSEARAQLLRDYVNEHGLLDAKVAGTQMDSARLRAMEPSIDTILANPASVNAVLALEEALAGLRPSDQPPEVPSAEQPG